MKKMTLCVAFAALSIAANAQVTVLPTGKAYFGDFPKDLTLSNNDPMNDVALQVFGTGKGGSKGMICFGDYGSASKNGRNVVVGEYGSSDTDQLWLHGKNGIFLTYKDGTKVVASYEPYKDNKFKFQCEVWAQNIKLTSDERLKSDIQPISNSLENLMKLNGVSYYLHSKPSASDKGNGLKANKVSNKKNIGLLAQELLKVYPELVGQDSDGYYAVDYIGLIPVLIESLKEQQALIEQLNDKLENVENENLNGSVLGDILSTKATLKQNAPNPFKDATVIEYTLPENAANAYIYVYDMTGAQLKDYKLNAKGNGSLTIKGSELKAGMYIYSLIVDGKVADTKRMILTK